MEHFDNGDTAKFSADFVAAFSDLARRLSESKVIVNRLELYYGMFGSWQMVVIKGDEAVKFVFDGKDSYLTAETSPVRKHSAPNEWKQATAEGVSGRYMEAITQAEAFLRPRFAL